ncbi:MAG: glycosyltransferase [Acidimicrobiia bacterium]
MPTDVRAFKAATQAARGGGAVVRTPKMPDAGDLDLINLAPTRPDLAAPVAGFGDFHTPSDMRPPHILEPLRHRGRKVVLCYRKSEINPGRYIEAALRRSGAQVTLLTDQVDLDRVDPETDLILFVESPYPALEVYGSTDVPILFWVHHGEHHLHTNIRLAERYQADAVLLAHSWHLAYWYPTVVHRFPFGMANELLDPSRPIAERDFLVAMVGAKLREGGPYGRRQQIVSALENHFPSEALGFRENVSSQDMAHLYANARIVVNEGGTRHYPITMRVLEAVGSGAVLLSDRLPGMEMILEPGEHFVEMGEDIVRDVTTLLADPDRMQEIADSSLERVTGLHTYDHRADELFGISADVVKRSVKERPTVSALASMVRADVEVRRVAQFGIPELADELPDREVWDVEQLESHRLAPGKMETIALNVDSVTDHHDLLRAARRYIYLKGPADGLSEYLSDQAPEATVTEFGDIKRVDLAAPSYRIMPFESTEA